jgi:hypothetical protein
MALNAAPIANYDSAEAGIKDLNTQAKLQGFAIITKRSKKDKQTPPTVRKLWLAEAVRRRQKEAAAPN